jgi:hypothetical protein
MAGTSFMLGRSIFTHRAPAKTLGSSPSQLGLPTAVHLSAASPAPAGTPPLPSYPLAFQPSASLNTSKWRVCQPQNFQVTYKYPPDWVIYGPDCSHLNPPWQEGQGEDTSIFSLVPCLQYVDIINNPHLQLIVRNDRYQVFHEDDQLQTYGWEEYYLAATIPGSSVVGFVNYSHAFELGSSPVLSPNRVKEIDLVVSNIVASARPIDSHGSNPCLPKE